MTDREPGTWISETRLPGGRRHGTYGAYSKDRCRCDECKAAGLIVNRRMAADRAERKKRAGTA